MNNGFIKIYLAGACKNVEDEGRKWRKYVSDEFYKISKYDALKSCIIDPTKYFSYSDPVHKNDRQVKNFYMSMIDTCDLVLINLEDSASSVGSGQEVQHAVDLHIPVIGIKGHNSYPWLENVDCDVVFDSIEEAIGYIKRYYMASAQPIGNMK